MFSFCACLDKNNYETELNTVDLPEVVKSQEWFSPHQKEVDSPRPRPLGLQQNAQLALQRQQSEEDEQIHLTQTAEQEEAERRDAAEAEEAERRAAAEAEEAERLVAEEAELQQQKLREAEEAEEAEKQEQLKKQKEAKQRAKQAAGGFKVFQGIITRDNCRNFKEPVGLDLISNKESLVISKVKDGAIAKWNKTEAKEDKILPGSVIVSVNGQNSKDDIMTELQKSVTLHMTLKRLSQEITLAGADANKKLGLDIDSCTMVVKSVSPDGLIAEWNRECPVGYEIVSTDRAIEVNGVRSCELPGSEQSQLMAEIRDKHLKIGGQLSMVFKRASE